MHRTRQGLCPVHAWGSITKHVLTYPQTNLDTPVNLVATTSKTGVCLTQIKSTQVLNHIRNTITQLGHDHLEFGPSSVGMQSILSSFAMMLHLRGIPNEKNMLQGRWRSTAFLTYIRVQVTKFSDGLNDQMTRNKYFYTVPVIHYDACRHDLLHTDFHNLRRLNVPQTQPGILAF